MRLFFAITIPEEIIAKVAQAQAQLRRQIGDDGVKWTRPEQFHYTLKFLGEQPPQRAYRAVEAAIAVCREQKPFTFAIGEVGAFPNNRRPGTLWIGATEGVGPMTDLALNLDRALAKEQFPREKRPLKAHLTLARIQTYVGETAAARALQSAQVEELGRFEVSRMALMQSHLKPSGAEYEIVETFQFKRIE